MSMVGEHLLQGQSALVSSHLLERYEIRRAYVRQGIWVALTILFELLLSNLVSSSSVQLLLFVAIVVEILLITCYVFVAAAPFARAAKIRISSRPVPPHLRERLSSVLAPIHNAMALRRKFDIRVNTEAQHWAPSVAEDDRGAILLLPVGFFKLLRSDEKAAIGIVAHELAHIKERDSWIFATQTTHARAFRYVIVPAILGLFLLGLVTPSPSRLLLVALIGALRDGHAVRNRLRMARITSEQRADLYACIHGDSEGLLRVFEEHTTRNAKQSSYMHPKIEDRVSLAKTTMHFLAKERAAAVTFVATPQSPQVSADLNVILSQADNLPERRRKYRHWRPGR